MDFPRENFSENFSHAKNIFWIFPKTISPKIFPGTLTKNFSGKRTVRDFPKMPHRTFRQILASNPRPVIRYPQRGAPPIGTWSAPVSPATQPAPYQDSLPEGVPGYNRHVFAFCRNKIRATRAA